MPSTTLTYSVAVGQRFAAALGEAWGLKDAQKQPRSASEVECKLFLIQRAQQLIVDVEGRKLEKSRGPVVVPSADIS